MLSPKNQAAMEQANAALAETIPPMVYAYHAGLVRAGFLAEQALRLTEAFQASLVMIMMAQARQQAKEEVQE